MAVEQLVRDIDLLVRSRYGLILLETREEDRALELLRRLGERMDLPLYTWSLTRGIRRDGRGASRRAPPARDPAATSPWSAERGTAISFDAFRRKKPPEEEGGTPYDTTHPLQALHHVEHAPEGALYLFSGLCAHLDDPVVAAKIRDAAEALSSRSGALVVTGTGVALPDRLRPLSATVGLPLPRPAEYRRLLREVIEEIRARRPLTVEMAPTDVTRLLNALRGMGLSEARRVLTRVVLDDGALTPGDVPRVLRAKAESLARDGLLELVPTEEGMGAVAGLAGLKRWLGKRARVLQAPERAAELGLTFPRGVLLLGVPGCGKSLSARMVASEWGLPLLRLDPAALYDRYVGESERNFRRALETAARLEPAVLWIDEIEKAFHGTGDNDGGVSTRILGTFLSWMQERTAELFLVATANDVSRLPPELLRKGRFDELFFVDLPGAAERGEILALHLRRRRQDPADFDLADLAAAAEGFSGAELEQVVVSSLYAALASGTSPATELLQREIERTRPLSVTRAEEIARLRAWARERAVDAG